MGSLSSSVNWRQRGATPSSLVCGLSDRESVTGDLSTSGTTSCSCGVQVASWHSQAPVLAKSPLPLAV
eukprot:scaffold212356_cov45-Prasinocladus_malaysianus.AAC.1